MYCWHCGERVDWDDPICPDCGADQSEEEGGSDWDDDDFPFIDEEAYH